MARMSRNTSGRRSWAMNVAFIPQQRLNNTRVMSLVSGRERTY
ncbi:Uncharacterised protein [Mycobacteroides abscessus subsp. abscessus]|nr:Uncharacterised protein [Mycobacteroides abscessus subsp. abscessus]